jgi:hypothetical protein
MHKFDLYGWYAGQGEGARTTPIAPANTSQTTTPGELRANFTGYEWVDLPYTTPAPIDTLTPARAAVWERIKSLRDHKTQSGGYTTGGKWFHSDTFSRTQQIGLVLMGAGVPAVQWKTMDGTFVTMTQTLAGQIFAAAAAQDQAMFAHAEALHASVDASETPTEIDINAGWPATYQP